MNKIIEDMDGNMWFATSNGGIFILNTQPIINYCQKGEPLVPDYEWWVIYHEKKYKEKNK